ncbi:MAG: hypothetical protein ACI4J0_11785 [Huintestinicola sp.]|uniref:hypothetical protein n=1 Tax=Huintestinicola sp. TaxID=2981661 RepID=UPI003EFC430D
MNKDFEKDYINSVDSSAPDMEKLWERISSSESADTDITPFVSAANECRKISPIRNNTFRAFAAAAAVFIAVICAVSVISDNDIALSESGNAAYFDEAEDYDYAAEEAAENEAAPSVSSSMGWEYSDRLEASENLSYLSLNLADTESSIYTALSRNTDDEEYFVEDNVLSETDFFLDGKVISEEPVGDGGIKYTVLVIHAVSEDSRDFSETEEVYSYSPYALRTGREYLLPISEENGRYTVIFDNAPQIEFTLDRQLVCHNGWKTLTENGVYLEYPQAYPDDFFYDRMNLAAESSLENLFDKWESLKA